MYWQILFGWEHFPWGSYHWYKTEIRIIHYQGSTWTLKFILIKLTDKPTFLNSRDFQIVKTQIILAKMRIFSTFLTIFFHTNESFRENKSGVCPQRILRMKIYYLSESSWEILNKKCSFARFIFKKKTQKVYIKNTQLWLLKHYWTHKRGKHTPMNFFQYASKLKWHTKQRYTR